MERQEKSAIWFDVQDPVEYFNGRLGFLDRLHRSIQESSSGVTVLSQLKIIGGLGGVGKTETARKYIHQFKQHYENVIWINAETKTSMENSFKRLADQLFSNMKDEIKNKPTEKIVRECYKTICKRESLVVFDNAQFYRDSTLHSDDGIQQFMPETLGPGWKRPFFLITSRNLDWVSLTPQLLELDMLEEDEWLDLMTSRNLDWMSPKPQILELDMLEEDECLDLINKELSSTVKLNEKDSRKLGRVLGGLPLALTQAVAYIREKCRKKQLSGSTFTLSDYLKKLKKMQKKLRNYLPRDSKTQSTVMTTWSVTLKLVEKLDNGELAIWLSQVLSILSPDGVPVSFLRVIVKGEMDQDKFEEAMDILCRYAFVKYSDDQRSVTMHRLVQFIILEQLQKKGELEKVLDFLVESCDEFVPRCRYKSRKLTDVEMTNIQCVVDKLRIVTSKSEFLLFQIQLARVHRFRYEYDQALALLKEVTARLDQKANKTIQCVIKMESALILKYQLKFEECDSMLENASALLPNHLKTDDPDVSEMMDERVKACVLAQQGKRQEALEMKNKICKEKLRCWWSSNLYLLQVFTDFEMPIFDKRLPWNELSKRISKHGMQIQNCEICTETNSIDILECLAKSHEFNYRYKEAFEMYREWYKEKENVLPADDPSLIQVLDHMVRLLFLIGRFDECKDTSKILYEKLVTIKRPHHPRVLTIMENFVVYLTDQQMYKEALEVCGVLCEDGEVVWGLYDSRVRRKMEELATILQSRDRHEEAVKVLKIVDERKCIDFQQWDPPEVAHTRYLIADALGKCGKFQEALEMFEVVHKIYEKRFSPNDYKVFKVMEGMSDTLWSLERFDESISVLEDLADRRKNLYGRDDPEMVKNLMKLITRKTFLRQKDKKDKKDKKVTFIASRH